MNRLFSVLRWLSFPFIIALIAVSLWLSIPHEATHAVAAEGDVGSIVGVITNADTGQRLAGVTVSIETQTLQTDTTGYYRFDNVPIGQHVVEASLTDFTITRQARIVIKDEVVWNSIALAPTGTPTATPIPPPTTTPIPQTGTLIGLITDMDTGERLAGVLVSVAGQSLVTDERGVYRFDGVPSGLQNVQAEREGYQSSQKTRDVIPSEVRWNSIQLTQQFSGCPTQSAAVFELIPIANPAVDQRPDFLHGDLNLSQRSYSLTTANLSLQDYIGGIDPDAPQLADIFEPNGFPSISSGYRVNHWDWGCGEHGCRGEPITDWPVTLLGLPTTPGQQIYIPERSPQIYTGDYKVMILYAEEKRITLGYTRDDSVAFGYAVHIEDVCVDPNLLSLYQAQNNAFGFRSSGLLPALRNDQPLGTAFSDEIQIAIRDQGTFLDPRSRKDWWRGY